MRSKLTEHLYRSITHSPPNNLLDIRNKHSNNIPHTGRSPRRWIRSCLAVVVGRSSDSDQCCSREAEVQRMRSDLGIGLQTEVGRTVPAAVTGMDPL
jgi:hypothetical protein